MRDDCCPVNILLLGCSKASESEGRMVFHYNQPEGISSLDPAFAKNQANMWAVHQLYNTLIETNDSLLPAPSLASRWEISDDRCVYTFFIRNDVYFHPDAAFGVSQSRRLTAYDVEYSFKRWQ
jgi:peptide/nickel transport system substrate-binding protein